MNLILISGLSGSGKSVALRLLEDSGFYCVDNLPVPMLTGLIQTLSHEAMSRVAVAMDVRSGQGLAALPDQLASLADVLPQVQPRLLYLDARDDVLLTRFAETRRKHPLAGEGMTLAEAIRAERAQLETIAPLGHRLDTSHLKANALRSWVRQFLALPAGDGLTLLFQSFGYKYGVPQDADLIFDVRCLPNPHYEPALRPLTGRDAPVSEFLWGHAEVLAMRADIQGFVTRWLPAYVRDNRASLTVGIGCTGGQHRSVCLVEWLGETFRNHLPPGRVLVRHRALAE